jgi:hypothetical protein
MGILDTVKESIKAGQKGEALRKVRQHRERLAAQQNQRDIERYEKIKAQRHAASHPNPVLAGAGVVYEKGRRAVQKVREGKESIQESREKFASRPGVQRIRSGVTGTLETLGRGFEQHVPQPKGRRGRSEHIRSPRRPLTGGGGGGLQYRGFGEAGGTGMEAMLSSGGGLPGFGNIITPDTSARGKFYRTAPMASPDFLHVFGEEPRYPRKKGRKRKPKPQPQEHIIRIKVG